MADKIPYELAITQACFMSGLGDQTGGRPKVTRDRGIVEARTGQHGSVQIITQERDVQTAWDPIDGDKQTRARDKLADSIRKLNPQPSSMLRITPGMWHVD